MQNPAAPSRFVGRRLVDATATKHGWKRVSLPMGDPMDPAMMAVAQTMPTRLVHSPGGTSCP